MNLSLWTIWERILKELEREIMPATINSWIKPLTPYKINEAERIFIILAPHEYLKTTFKNRYEKDVTYVVCSVLNDEYTVKVLLESEVDRNAPFEKERSEQSDFVSNLNPKYTFDNFVKGRSNQLAFSAASFVAQNYGRDESSSKVEAFDKSSFNPLFLHGGVGLGKTHLMHSIGNYIRHVDPSIKVLYTTAENLMNEFINSLKDRKNQEFRDKYRNIDVLLVDDIQFLFNKEGTQDEFFHTYNALHNANKQIVITSDRPPHELESFHERLLSRFGNGTMVDISLPDFETRAAILEKKSEMRHLKISPEVIRYIAKNIPSNIRVLEGALNAVAAYANLTKSPITLDMAEVALKDRITTIEKKELTIDLVQEIVGDYYNITKEHLKSKTRTAQITECRHMAMYLCRMLIDKTHFEIGQAFGKRDHTSVIYACNKVSEELEKKPDLKETIIELEKKIKESGE